MSSLLKIQQLLATQRKAITTVFLVLHLVMMGVWFVVYVKALLDYPSVVAYLFSWGPWLGKLAVWLYCITLLPGIITRLQWLPRYTQPIASMILPLRRHIGILMFITAFVHMSFTTSLPYYAAYNFDPPGFPALARFQWFGLAAWILLFPLWLTSNDWSVKKLGKWWKMLHRLTYLALFGIFAHVGLQGVSTQSVLLGVVSVLLLISWIRYWMRHTQQPE